jgi:hypothetical protein
LPGETRERGKISDIANSEENMEKTGTGGSVFFRLSFLREY